MELAKEDFYKAIKNLATKTDLKSFVTKAYFDKAIKALNLRLDSMDNRVDSMGKRIAGMDDRVNSMNDRMDGIANRMGSMITKDYLRDYLDNKLLEFPTKDEFYSLKASVEDIQEKVARIDRRTDEDFRAIIKDIIKLKRRVTVVEHKFAA